MKTVREIFRDSIADGNWEGIRQVFQAMTGEKAPHPPKQVDKPTLDDILDKKLSPLRSKPANPLDMPMEIEQEEDVGIPAVVLPPVEEDEDEGDDEEDLIAPEEEYQVPERLLAHSTAPADDDPAREFYIDQGQAKRTREREDGETVCRKESMSIPDQRKNRFHDNGKAFADEKVNKVEGAVEKGLGIGKVSERDRPETTLVRVQCGLCKNWEEVSPMLAQRYHKDPDHNTYRCNSCTTPSGRVREMRKQREAELSGGRRASRSR